MKNAVALVVVDVARRRGTGNKSAQILEGVVEALLLFVVRLIVVVVAGGACLLVWDDRSIVVCTAHMLF
jgi:hypothetical protein